jgi:hypothetical protein
MQTKLKLRREDIVLLKNYQVHLQSAEFIHRTKTKKMTAALKE